LALNVSRSQRRLVAGNVTVTEFPEAGLKVRPAAALIVVNDDPSLDPETATVCVRVAHAAAGGSFNTTRPTLTVDPRSTVSDCGNALFALSQ
jgi:hypothetical protein